MMPFRIAKADNRKIKAKAVTIDGIEFMSKAEGQYYLLLKEKKARGEIADFSCQPVFELQPACTRYGKKYKPITYTPDFLVTYHDGQQVAVDVKGYGMEDAVLKRKMFAYKFPDIELRWVAQSGKWGTDGWIDYDNLKKCRRQAKKIRAQGKGGVPLW